MKIILTAFLGLVLPFLAYNQSYTIPATPVLRYLYKTENEINSISKTNKLFLFPIKLGKMQARFNLLKNRNGLFALVEGTGKVFKAVDLTKNNITFTRIDSTHFYGNNYNAIIFSYDGIIYSFGGYGFWNKNGLLSHFTHGAEWSIDKINKKFKTDNDLYTYQSNKSIIYYIEFPFKDESINENDNQTNVIVFDIIKKENKILGKLNDKLKLQYNYLHVDVPSINGILVGSSNEILLLNFTYNKVYKLINLKIIGLLNGNSGSEIQTLFENEGRIFYTSETDTSLRSLKVSMSDFKEEPYPIFISEKNELNKGIIFIAFVVIFIIIILLTFYKQRNRKSKIEELAVTSDKEEIYISDLNSNEFNSIEENLINRLIEKSNIDSYLTVDELNSILGIKKKTIEIQKRVRTEAINRINHKFNINYNLETAFIERTRSAEDRRYFNYIISKKNIRIYTKYPK
jgi:hypothetical protein